MNPFATTDWYVDLMRYADQLYRDELGRGLVPREGVDLGGLASVVSQARESGAQHEDLVQWIRASEEWQRAHPPEPQPQPHPQALQGPLRLVLNPLGYVNPNNLGFADNTGFVLPVFCHAGDLLALYARDPDWACAELDDIAAAGYHGVRTWTELSGPYWDGLDRSIGPDSLIYLRNVSAFAEALRARSLRWIVSQGWRITPAIMTDLATTLRDAGGLDVVAAVDGGNETWHLAENTPEHLRRCVDAFRAVLPVPVWSLTSPPGEDKAELDRYAGSVYDVHGSRAGHWYDKIRHAFSVAYEQKPARRLGIQSEPPGPGELVSVTDFKDELDAEAMGLLHVMHLMSRQATVYFSSPGVSVRERGEFSRQPGFWTVPAWARMLPNDLMSWPTLLHGSSRGRILSAVSVGDGIIRVDQALDDDGRFVAIVYGPGGFHQIPVERDCELEILNQVVAKQTFVAGQQMDTQFRRGLIVLGRLL